MVQLNCHWASHRSQDHPPIWLAPLLHSLSTFPFYTPLYSSSLPPLYFPFLLTCHKTTPQSQDHPPKWLSPLWHSLSTFLSILLFTVLYLLYDQPSFDNPTLYFFSTSSLHSLHTPFLHPLSTYSTLEDIVMKQLNHSWAAHRSQDTPPPRMTSPPLTLPLYIPFLYSLSTLLP